MLQTFQRFLKLPLIRQPGAATSGYARHFYSTQLNRANRTSARYSMDFGGGKRAPRPRSATGQPLSGRVRPTERSRRSRDRRSLGAWHVHPHRCAAARWARRPSSGSTLPDGTYLALTGRVAHMLTPSRGARTRSSSRAWASSSSAATRPSRIKLRAHVDSDARPRSRTPACRRRPRSIVVEPSTPLRTRMARCLESAGFKVTAVVTTTEALEACTQWRPDAIVAAAALDRR